MQVDSTEHLQDHPQHPAPATVRPQGSARTVAAGVIGALTLGVGMGLWARPASPSQPGLTVAPATSTRPALQIVVDDTPAPLGPLLEVLPGDLRAVDARPVAPPLAPIPEPVAPRRPAAGLMKVDAIVAAEPLLTPAVKIEPAAEPAKPKPRLQKAKVEKPKIEAAKLAGKPRVERTKPDASSRVAKAGKPKAAKAKVAKAKTSAPKAKATKLAKVEKPKTAKVARAEVRKAKADKPKAEPRRMAVLVKAVKTTPRKLKAEVSKTRAALTRSKPAKIEKVVAKPARTPPARKPAPKGQGPMRIARNDTCASPDAGEAAVCGDRRLGARDRQLQQAYRNAEAAGVPASALRRQQTRWLQARAAAAREAPWAVEDVYEARISELNDLTRDAREN